jgi:hypothetical protein
MTCKSTGWSCLWMVKIWSECAGDDDEDVPCESSFDLTEVIWNYWYYPRWISSDLYILKAPSRQLNLFPFASWIYFHHLIPQEYKSSSYVSLCIRPPFATNHNRISTKYKSNIPKVAQYPTNVNMHQEASEVLPKPQDADKCPRCNAEGFVGSCSSCGYNTGIVGTREKSLCSSLVSHVFRQQLISVLPKLANVEELLTSSSQGL